MTGARAKLKAGFHYNIQEWPVLECGGDSFARKPHPDPRLDGHQAGRKSAGGASASTTESKKKGSHVNIIPDASQSAPSLSSSSSYVVQVGTLPKFLDQWRSIMSNIFVFNMMNGHYLQLRYCCPLFHNFRQFNIKATPAHHPIFKKELDDLLTKCAFEPSTDGAGFYPNIFVLEHTGGLCPILNLKCFNHYISIPTFRKPL